MGWRYRKALKKYLDLPNLQLSTVNALKLDWLKQEQIQALVLDFDGVLAGDHALMPLEVVKPWLEAMYNYYQERLFILSNKPLPLRQAYLAEHYPKLQFIKGVAKKPYPEGLELIKTKTGLSGAYILFCDDRLLTGVLAAELAQVRVLWVTQPFHNLCGRFWHELFFICLRIIDRNFLRLFA
jgi:HAD superfamily phosphatase (TIGR01668 family)